MEYRIARMEKPDWERIPKVMLRETGWLSPCGIEAFAQLCHDGENLYIRMEAVEQEIRAEETEPLSQICDDSCLEFFFAPDENDARYFNFEWNPLGNLYFGFGAERSTRVRQIISDRDGIFLPKPYRTETGWGIEYRVPKALVRMYFPDFDMRGNAAGNFYKCGDKTKHPHYLAWSPLTSEKPDYHRRWDFGKMVFEA